eukprot:scaffold3208_cov402-Prasinococcus_capsulatus_cf.AAC.9
MIYAQPYCIAAVLQHTKGWRTRETAPGGDTPQLWLWQSRGQGIYLTPSCTSKPPLFRNKSRPRVANAGVPSPKHAQRGLHGGMHLEELLRMSGKDGLAHTLAIPAPAVRQNPSGALPSRLISALHHTTPTRTRVAPSPQHSSRGGGPGSHTRWRHMSSLRARCELAARRHRARLHGHTCRPADGYN